MEVLPLALLVGRCELMLFVRSLWYQQGSEDFGTSKYAGGVQSAGPLGMRGVPAFASCVPEP